MITLANIYRAKKKMLCIHYETHISKFQRYKFNKKNGKSVETNLRFIKLI